MQSKGPILLLTSNINNTGYSQFFRLEKQRQAGLSPRTLRKPRSHQRLPAWFLMTQKVLKLYDRWPGLAPCPAEALYCVEPACETHQATRCLQACLSGPTCADLPSAPLKAKWSSFLPYGKGAPCTTCTPFKPGHFTHYKNWKENAPITALPQHCCISRL